MCLPIDSVKDYKSLKMGHRTCLWCSQDISWKKKSKLSENPSVVHRDHVSMNRYKCQSCLIVLYIKGSSNHERKVSVQIKHHERHEDYYDVSMPSGAADIIHENIVWSTPVSIILKVQAVYPQVTGKQIYKAWTQMSEVLWKRDKAQLPSVRALLAKFGDDVDIFKVEVAPSVQQLYWGMKKILEGLHGKVVEIAIDATCE